MTRATILREITTECEAQDAVSRATDFHNLGELTGELMYGVSRATLISIAALATRWAGEVSDE